MDHPILLVLVKVTIFTLMLAIGVTLSFEQLTSLWRRPAFLLRSLLAVVVLVPVVVILLLYLLDLPAHVATGLAVLAAAPGAPLTTQRSHMAGGSIPYAASLQLSLALLAVGVTPLLLTIFYSLFALDTERVGPVEVARQIAVVQLLPVSIGLLIQRIAPTTAQAISKPLTLVANILFVLLIAAIIVPGTRTTMNLGAVPIAAIVVMVALALMIGHVSGGGRPGERAALAVSCIARNVGLGLFITVLSHVEQHVVPTLLAYMIVGAIVAIPYSVWSKRRMA